MADSRKLVRLLSFDSSPRRASTSGATAGPRARGESSRRIHNEKVASVVRRFLIARVAFDAIYETFGSPEKEELVRFDAINTFVEHTMFGLKEECHALFRKEGRPAGDVLFVEDLFDVLIGAAFHEMMKIKENCYILEHYGPTFREMTRKAERRIRVPDYERLFFRAYKRMIVHASSGVFDDINSARDLFLDATEHLLRMLPRFAHNGLVTRMLFEQKQLVEMVYGEDGLRKVLGSMYDGHVEHAYLHAASSCLDAGRYDEARSYCEQSLAENPQCVGAKRLLARLDRRGG